MTHSHDNAYKLLFSEPQMVIDLLQGFVHEPWVAAVDFSTLEKMSAHYVSDDLRSREDDVIWRVKCQDEWLYVYLLLEFQSSVDYFMAVRLMTYIGLLYQDLLKQEKFGKSDKLPPVFPVVLYNGKRRWTAATELSELIGDLPNGFDKYKPSLSYLLLDEGRFSADELNPLKNLVAAVFRLENAKTRQEVVAVLDDLLVWLVAPEQERLKRTFNIWIKRVLRSSKKVTHPIDNLKDLTEVRTMLAETIDSWFIEREAAGIKKGIAEGIKEGMEKAKQERLKKEQRMLKQMVGKIFDDATAESVGTLLEQLKISDDIEQISDWIVSCETAQELLENIKQLLSIEENKLVS